MGGGVSERDSKAGLQSLCVWCAYVERQMPSLLFFQQDNDQGIHIP